MEIALHYSARLRDAGQFNNLVQEAMELAKQVKWPTIPVDFGKLRGIIIIPRRCSPFYLCFTADGKTCSLEKVGDKKPKHEFYSMVHVTTIYARAEVHMALVKLLRYLGDKYLDDLNVMDEGEYWSKGNAAELRYQFGRIEHLSDSLLGNDDWKETITNEPPGSVATLMERLISERKVSKEQSTGDVA